MKHNLSFWNKGVLCARKKEKAMQKKIEDMQDLAACSAFNIKADSRMNLETFYSIREVVSFIKFRVITKS